MSFEFFFTNLNISLGHYREIKELLKPYQPKISNVTPIHDPYVQWFYQLNLEQYMPKFQELV